MILKRVAIISDEISFFTDPVLIRVMEEFHMKPAETMCISANGETTVYRIVEKAR